MPAHPLQPPSWPPFPEALQICCCKLCPAPFALAQRKPPPAPLAGREAQHQARHGATCSCDLVVLLGGTRRKQGALYISQAASTHLCAFGEKTELLAVLLLSYETKPAPCLSPVSASRPPGHSLPPTPSKLPCCLYAVTNALQILVVFVKVYSPLQ